MKRYLPDGISLDEAYSGENANQRRPLHALERDVLCRILDDIFKVVIPLHEMNEDGKYEITRDKCQRLGFKDAKYGGIRLEPFEVPLLVDVYNAINPRGGND